MSLRPLRKVLELPLFGESVQVDVDFRLIEIMERAFNMSADQLIPRLMNIESIQRRHLADVVADMLVRKVNLSWKRDEIREHVITLEVDQYMALAALLLSALLFSMRQIDGEQFDKTKAEISDSGKKKDSPTTADS